jgi:transcriptional regulator with XRE-family HTH domain
MQLTLGSYLKSIRESGGYSLRDIERRSGYSMCYIIAIEKGRRVPKPFALGCILDSLNLKESQREVVASLLLESAKAC